jgi:hypothetical protein
MERPHLRHSIPKRKMKAAARQTKTCSGEALIKTGKVDILISIKNAKNIFGAAHKIILDIKKQIFIIEIVATQH